MARTMNLADPMTTTKKELRAQIQSIEERIAKLKRLPTVVIDDHEMHQMDLQKLEATRDGLLEKVQSASE